MVWVLVYAGQMSERYDTPVRVGVRQIVAPIGAGEARIPALVRLPDARILLFYDERPAPASGTGSDFNGLTMASDLPNPNRIRWMECDARGEWSDPRSLPEGAPPVSSDACVGVDADGVMHLAFASSEGAVGYMDSRAHGERLRAWWAWGSGPEDLTYADVTDALYECTGADALFATSGATASVDGDVAMPYVVRVGERTCVQVVYARGGRIVRLADCLVGPEGILLDETSVTVWGGRVVANCRLQGFEGRGSGARYLAWGDGQCWEGGCLWELDDPGCNACQIGDVFVHPGGRGARALGQIVRVSPPWRGPVRARVVASLGRGAFGYSDALIGGGEAVVVFERGRGLWEVSCFPEQWEMAVPAPG